MALVDKIENWLLSKGVYNCIVRIDGEPFRLNRSLGLMRANEDDLKNLPEFDCPFQDELKPLIVDL